MQFLDAIGLAYFWEKIKSWVGKNYLSLNGGDIHGSINVSSGGSITVKETEDSILVSMSSRLISGVIIGDNGKQKDTFVIDGATGNISCYELTASKVVKTDGTATQVLMADGSVRTLNAANGIAGLDSNGNVPLANLGNLDTTVAEVVTELPTSNIKRHIYLVKDSDTANNKYAEYVYTGDISAAYDSTKWEKLGDFRATVDLADYAKKNEVVGLDGIELEKIPQGQSTKQVITFSNINKGDATSVTFENATTSMAGFMSASDKNKLDGISSGATADSAIPTSVIDALN